jgi:hypothetical protein
MPRLYALALGALLAAAPSIVLAQSSPNFSRGQVPTAGQWNAAFATKQDRLTFTPLNQAGGTMVGKLQAAPATVNGAGFSLLPGVAPTTPSNGDLWVSGGSLFARLNGLTTALAPLSSPTFSGTTTIPQLAITGPGSTGPIDDMSVTPSGGVSGSLKDKLGGVSPVTGLKSTLAYANPMTINSPIRSELGTFPANFDLNSAGASPSSSAIVGAVSVPPGTYTGPYSWPDAGGSFYGLNANPNKFSLGLYAAGGITGSGNLAEGINATVVNCELFASTCTGTTGKDFNTLYGGEFDANVYGIGPTAPTGRVAGVISILHATKASTGPMNAYEVSSAGNGGTGGTPIPWKTGFATNPGTATTGMSLSSASATGPSNSQTINMTALNASNAPILGSVVEDSAGNLVLTNGVTSSFVLGAYYPQGRISTTDAAVASKISTSATTGASAGTIWQTGSAGSSATFQINDSGAATLTLGSALNGLTITAPGLVVGGNLAAKMQTISAAPTSSQIAAGYWSVFKRTDDGSVKICANDNGTIKCAAMN